MPIMSFLPERQGSTYYSATLSATGWSDTVPHTQTITVQGMTSSITPIIAPSYSAGLSTALAEKEAWACVDQAITGTNTITFKCLETKPETAITVQIGVIV